MNFDQRYDDCTVDFSTRVYRAECQPEASTLLDRNLVAAVQLQTRRAHAPNLGRMHAVQRPGRSRLAVT